MKNKLNVTTINDEISDDLNETIEFLKLHNIKFVELRTIHKKNLVDYSLAEIKGIHELLSQNDIGVSALASPLFKWYPNEGQQESAEKVDTFNFNPHLSLESKRFYIKKAIATAKILQTKNIRIFSSLKSPLAKYNFIHDPLLKFALNEAENEKVTLLLENEPPCYIHKMKDIKTLANKLQIKNFGIWFDISNFYKINEQVFLKDLEILKDQIKYIHLKDFDINDQYVALGQGVINYKRIISDVKKVFKDKEIFLSIETHVRPDTKRATAQSIETLRKLILEERVGYGIVGCGQVFTKHGSAIARNERSELRAVFDIDEKRAKESAMRFDCEVKISFESLLNDDQIKIVNVRTPNDTHVDLVLQSLKKRKICLCEKPLCLTAKEGRKIINSKFYKDNVIVNFQNRFNPAVSTLFDILKSKKLGKILLCSIDVRWWRENFYFNDWHGNKKRVGGMLFNQGAHALDIMYQICGHIKNVKKIEKCLRNKSNVDDIYLALIEFQNGAVGAVEMTTYTKYRNCEASVFVIGEKGSIKLSGPSFNKIEFFSTNDNTQGDFCFLKAHQEHQEKEDSHFRLIKALNEYILTGKKDERIAMAEDGIIVTQIIESLYR